MFRKILVPLDGSELAERALGPATELAQIVNGEILLLGVVVPEVVVAELSGVSTYWIDQATVRSGQEISEHLQTVQRTLAKLGCMVRVAIKEGDPASEIVDTAVEEDMELIVMSTHGRSGFTRWMMGSVTTKVLHKASCPVLAIRSAFEVAKRLGAQITLLTVQATSEIDLVDVMQLEKAERGLGKRVQQQIYAKDEAYLQNIADGYEASTGLKTQITVADGPVAQAILHFADEWDADLIVMATHGRTGLRRWVYGSVTEKILRSAHCAMMIIRPPAHKLN
jgi:nucleotide-binding universal stress UspA family protein